MYYEVEKTHFDGGASGSLHTHTHTHTQAQQPSWVVNNSIVNLTTKQVTSNPLASTPDNTQNAVWDVNGNLQFYEEDGFIYNAVGQVMSPDVGIGYMDPPTTGHSEFIFVPIPGECDRWYGMTMDRIDENSSYYYKRDLILSYSVLDGSLNQGNGGVVQTLNQNSGYGYLMNANWIVINEKRDVLGCNDKYHIGVSQLQNNGNKRYLFATACADLIVFEITQNGIQEVHTGEFSYQGATPFRSELEISEDDSKIRVSFGTITKVTRNDGTLVDVGGIDIFTFSRHYSGDLQFLQHQEVELGDRYGDIYVVKGLEFSSNGKELYATYVKYNRNGVYYNPNDMTMGSKIIHLSRTFLPFGLFPEIDLGVGNEGFSLGMIEKGIGDEMLFIRDSSIGRFANGNDPNSSFNNNYISLETPTTNHTPLWPTSFNVFNRIRLLPDQVDGEDFNITTYNSDQFPETLYVCDFTVPVHSNFQTIWSFTARGSFEDVIIASGKDAQIPGEGQVTASYINDKGCEINETFYVLLFPVVQFGADFAYATSTYVNSNGSVVLSIGASPYANVLTGHTWILQKSISNSWVTVSTVNNTYPVFTNLSVTATYRLVHEVLPIHQPFECMFNQSTSQIINQ